MKHAKVLCLMTVAACVLIFFTSALADEPQVKSVNPIMKPQVTFVELGSKSCIPCKLMQPVMRSVESKYGWQLKVVFYDVSSTEHRHYAKLYSIRIIPTQVFMDGNGKEFFRHEGFFSEKEIDTLLKQHGIMPLK